MKRTKIIGCGSYLPKKIMTNDDLSKIIDTNDEWIRERTGIKQRHIAAEGEYTSHMAINAALDALKTANKKGEEVDLIVLATSTPDETFPATATKVQHGIKAGGVAFDVQAVCSGFLYALAVADGMMRSNVMNDISCALVIGSDSYSRILDWEDRGTCVLFGDGAGAVVLEQCHEDEGIQAIRLFSDGSGHDSLYVDGGPSTTGTAGKLRMNGTEVFRKAVTCLCQASHEVLKECKMNATDIDWLIPHQANKRIMDRVAHQLDISLDKLVVTVDCHANTSAASIPLALAAHQNKGGFTKGETLLINAIGGGLTWGAGIIKW